ncbi:NAD(P)/FAD-dependent oxidoreductase [Streptomyces longwoodensis]|uniref:NAD(P)/FAD-dependent oxidoreductase n=1 Tax=Streptomyces longwoodensis TaxID=68231 RepID=UPI0033CF2D41
MRYANAMLALPTSGGGSGRDYIVELDMSLESLEKELEDLFFKWVPSNSRVVVEGSTGTRDGSALRHFLYRTGVPYVWESRAHSQELAVYIDGVRINPPTPSRLYVALGIIPAPIHVEKNYPYDLVVVGGGPAGLSAALSASLVGFSTLVIEAQRPGGTATTSINLIRNYLGFPGGLAGTRLAKLALEQMAALNIDWQSSYAARALRKSSGGRYEIQVGSNSDDFVSAGTVLLACGQKPTRLTLGEEQHTEERFLNRGVYYGAVPSDRLIEVDKDVVIVGGGDSAGQAALLFAKGGSKSIAIVAQNGLTMAKPLREEVRSQVPDPIRVFTGVVTGFAGAEHLTTVRVAAKNLETDFISATSAYISIGGDPNTRWLEGSGVDLDNGYVKTDVHLGWGAHQQTVLPFETSLPGVFAAGDVRVNASRRVGQAVGQGAAAVASMERYVRENPRVLVDPQSTARLLLDILDVVDTLDVAARQKLKQWLIRRLVQ